MNLTTSTTIWMKNTTYIMPTLNTSQAHYIQNVLKTLIPFVVSFNMLGVGCGAEWKNVLRYLKKPTGVVVGILCQYMIMPLVVLSLAKVLTMSYATTLGLLVIGACPGGTFSNMFTYWLDGDLDLSITMTFASSLFGFGGIPLLLYLYSLGFKLDLSVPYDIIAIMLSTLTFPILIGMLIRHKFPKQARWILKVFTVIGMIIVIVSMTLFFITHKDNIRFPSNEQLLCTAFLSSSGMILGYGMSYVISIYPPLYLNHFHKKTIAIETGEQNIHIGITVIQLSSLTFKEKGNVIIFMSLFTCFLTVWVVFVLICYRAYRIKVADSRFDEPTSAKLRIAEDLFGDKCEKMDSGKINAAFDGTPEGCNEDSKV